MRLIEPYAGLAAYSLYHAALRSGGRREPPVSRVGNKMRYAEPVTRAWGIRDVTDVHVNDLCPLMTGLHLVYVSTDLRREVARRIWAMIPCPVCLPELVQQALQGLAKPQPKALQGRSGCEACHGSGVRDCRALWEATRKRTIPPDVLAALKLERDWIALPGLADVLADGIFLQSRNFQLKPMEVRESWCDKGFKPEVDGYHRAPGSHAGGEDSPRWAVGERLERIGEWRDRGLNPEDRDNSRLPRDSIASRLSAISPSGVRWHVTHTDATKALPPGDLSDAVVILDPPYANTTGYGAKSARADVVELALDADRRGALVLIHEAEAVIPGWHVRNAAELHDYKSTHWAEGQMRETITANRKPGWWPARQVGLFG